MRLTTIVLAILAAIGVTAPAHAIITKKECKPVQATCKAAACSAGTPSGACLCNNSCNCTGRIDCYVNGVVVEHHECGGDCVKTPVQAADPNETPTETSTASACAPEPENDQSPDSDEGQNPAPELTIAPEPTQPAVAKPPTP